MIKVKLKDKNDTLKCAMKYKKFTVLECIVLLDESISLLKDEFNLLDTEITKLLKEYRTNLKKK